MMLLQLLCLVVAVDVAAVDVVVDEVAAVDVAAVEVVESWSGGGGIAMLEEADKACSALWSLWEALTYKKPL